MTDQMIALAIFTALLVLSILPISTMQTRILFNQSFTELIERKIHRQNLLNKLYTPGFFHKAEADPTVEDTGRRGSILSGMRARAGELRSSIARSNTASASAMTLAARRGSSKKAVVDV